MALARVARVARRRRYALLLAAYGLFLALGAAAFAALERPPERALHGALRDARARLLAQHAACLSEGQLARLLERLVAARSYGVAGLANASADESWEFTSALFFAASVLTTTGYGHTVPLSDWGKIFCVLYAFLGIPLTLLFLACLLQHLLPILSFRPVQYIHSRWGFQQGHVALVHTMALGLATLGLFILIPAICFWALESNWNFLESVYFCFISLSTIGLGDYVPKGTSPILHPLYELSITCYLLVGLLAMLVTLETAYQLREVRALVSFFAPTHNSPQEEDDYQLEILPRDQFALATVSGST